MSSDPALESQRLAAVLRSVVEAIIATDGLGRITLINSAAEKLFATSSATSFGQDLRDLNRPLGNWLERAIEEKIDHPLAFELKLDEHYFSVSLAPLQINQTDEPGWVAVLQDVTHLKRLEEWKSEALQTTAHDLRNPLNLIIGATNFLRETLPNPAPNQREYFEMLKMGAERIGALTDQLLNLERIEAGTDITMSKLTLRRIIEDVVKEFKLVADDKRLQLNFEGAAASTRVLGDESWLHRAASNLIGNAVKYTPPGGQVRVIYREADQQGVLEVIDTGPGISQAAQARLFERFYRVRTETTRKTPGTGLGLAIVKAIIDKHGGRVWVASEEGKGSTFGFSVPLLK